MLPSRISCKSLMDEDETFLMAAMHTWDKILKGLGLCLISGNIRLGIASINWYGWSKIFQEFSFIWNIFVCTPYNLKLFIVLWIFYLFIALLLFSTITKDHCFTQILWHYMAFVCRCAFKQSFIHSFHSRVVWRNILLLFSSTHTIAHVP